MTASAEEVAEAWRESANRLVATLRRHRDPELQAAVVRKLVRGLGGIGFPGFLKIVLIVAESEDEAAKRDLARVFGVCLRHADLPAGELTSWGASTFWSGDESLSADELRAQSAGVAPRRKFGPIEYLTVWYCQRTQRPFLSAEAYRDSCTKLVDLIGRDDEAARLYPVKIENDVATGLDGAFTRQVSRRLTALAAAWRAGHEPGAVVDAAIGAGTGTADERDRWLGAG